MHLKLQQCILKSQFRPKIHDQKKMFWNVAMIRLSSTEAVSTASQVSCSSQFEPAG